MLPLFLMWKLVKFLKISNGTPWTKKLNLWNQNFMQKAPPCWTCTRKMLLKVRFTKLSRPYLPKWMCFGKYIMCASNFFKLAKNKLHTQLANSHLVVILQLASTSLEPFSKTFLRNSIKHQYPTHSHAHHHTFPTPIFSLCA